MVAININNEYLDLSEEVIAVDFKNSTINEINTRSGSKSIKFKIPGTDKNHRLINFRNRFDIIDSDQYKKIDNVILEQKSTGISKGFLKVNTYNEKTNTYEARFFGDNVSWFDLSKSFDLSEIDLSQYDHVRNEASIINSISNTEGYIYPMIDYGTLDTVNNQTINYSELYPAVYVHSLMKLGFRKIGFKLSGEILDIPLYQKLIIPFSKGQFVRSGGSLEGDTARAVSQIDVEYTVQSPVDYVDLQFPDDNEGNWAYDTEDRYNTANYTYTHPASADYNLVIEPILAAKMLIPSGGVDFNIATFKNAVIQDSVNQNIPGSSSVFYSTLTPSQKLNNVTLNPGDTLQIKIRINSGSLTIEPNLQYTYVWFKAVNEITFDGQVNLSSSLPNIKFSDLVKYVIFTFNAIPVTDNYNKTITLTPFRNIKRNISNAVNWSNKVDTGKSIEVDFTEVVKNYGRKSIIAYKPDENDPQVNEYLEAFGINYGDGVINIQNEYIDDTKTIYEFPFAPTRQIATMNNEAVLPYIPLTLGGEDNDIEQRVLICEPNSDLDEFCSFSTLTIQGDVSSDTTDFMPYAYFHLEVIPDFLAQKSDTLVFDMPFIGTGSGFSLKESYYTDIIRILNGAKMLKIHIDLNQIDINNLDFTKPVRLSQYNAYFYINSINKYKGTNETTEVELIQLV